MTGSTKARPGPQGLAAKPGAITSRRTRAGLSVTEFARRLGMSHGHLSNVENGRRKVSPATAVGIARFLDAPLGDLFQL